MSNYTVEEVEKEADFFDSMTFHKAAEMIRELAHRLRQEEEENKRDPVTDPRPGDMIQYKDGSYLVYCEESEDNLGGTTDREFWRSQAKHGASTIIRRREVPQ